MAQTAFHSRHRSPARTPAKKPYASPMVVLKSRNAGSGSLIRPLLLPDPETEHVGVVAALHDKVIVTAQLCDTLIVDDGDQI